MKMKRRLRTSRNREGASKSNASGVRNLPNVPPGEGGKVVHIEDEVKSQVAAMGIRVGCHLVLDSRQPLKGPVVVKVGNMVTSIGRRMAQGIEVKVDP